MNINWKLRLKNKATLTALVGILVAAVYQVAALFGFDFGISQDSVIEGLGLLITVLAGFGIVVDPTTQGASDSAQAMGYSEPKQE